MEFSSARWQTIFELNNTVYGRSLIITSHYYYYYYDCTGQAAAADRALIYNKSLINYGTHN